MDSRPCVKNGQPWTGIDLILDNASVGYWRIARVVMLTASL